MFSGGSSFWSWLFKPCTGCFKLSYLSALDPLWGSALRTLTLYKQQGNDPAIKRELYCKTTHNKTLISYRLHCWSPNIPFKNLFFFPLIWSTVCSFAFKSCWQKRKWEKNYNKQIQDQQKCLDTFFGPYLEEVLPLEGQEEGTYWSHWTSLLKQNN